VRERALRYFVIMLRRAMLFRALMRPMAAGCASRCDNIAARGLPMSARRREITCFVNYFSDAATFDVYSSRVIV